jgi:ribonuclease/clavin/mitogillin
MQAEQRARQRPTWRPTAQADGEPLAPAAAVLLTRGQGGDLELYLVQRSPKLRVFPGFWALPGGGLDPLDGDPEDPGLAAYRRAAARELFEETGVLTASMAAALARAGVAPAELRRGLAAAEADPRGPAARAAERSWALQAAAAPLAPEEFEPLCWTVTPRFTQRRFRALYVHLALPPGAEPRIEAGELVAGRWVAPASVLNEWRRGELDLVPPLVFLVERLAESGGRLDPAFDACERRSAAIDAGALHAVSPAPGVLLMPLRTPTLPPAATTNCVWIGGGIHYLVDPATHDPAERRRLLEFLAEQPPLAGLIVTHHHPDHVGSVEPLARELGLPVYAHPLTLTRLPAPIPDPRPLHEGERLPLGRAPDGQAPWELEALHTPGHDRGHLCLFERRYRTLIAGDLVSTLSTIVIEPPEGHLATYLEQLRRVRALEPRRLIPSHGPAVADGAELLELYLRHREHRESQLLQALVSTGGAEAEGLLALVYSDVPPRLLPLARGSLWAGLHKLHAEGRARFVPGEPPLASSRSRLPAGEWRSAGP